MGGDGQEAKLHLLASLACNGTAAAAADHPELFCVWTTAVDVEQCLSNVAA